MAGVPKWKVYRGGEYIGSTKYAEDAAALVCLSPWGVVKYDHRIVVWQEGSEEITAAESYDLAADIMRGRVPSLKRAGMQP